MSKVIVVYAEKKNMAYKIAAGLGGIILGSNLINSDNLIKYEKEIDNAYKSKGAIPTKYKNKTYIVTWGSGHFCTLFNYDDYKKEEDGNTTKTKWRDIPSPFIPEIHKVKLRANCNERQYKNVSRYFLSDRCEYIINATDYEREGELIFEYLYDFIFHGTQNGKDYKRLQLNEITPEAIRKGFDNLVSKESNIPKVLGAKARSEADWEVGINLTVASTLNLSPNYSMLNIGRVLTPTLNLIVERHNEVINFKATPFYYLKAIFRNNKGIVFEAEYKETKFKTKEEAENLLNQLKKEVPSINKIETQKEIKVPELPHDTQTLQIVANQLYGFTLEKTLNIAQKLYENSFITYPRVDSRYLNKETINKTENLIKNLAKLPQYKEAVSKIPNINLSNSKAFNDNKVEAHPAIIVTDKLPTNNQLSEDEEKIYDIIARRTIALAYPNYEAEKTTITILFNNYYKYPFVTSGKVILENGYRELEKVNNKENIKTLPTGLNEGDALEFKTKIAEGTTTAPKEYTDASLISAMQTCGRKIDNKEYREILNKTKGIGRPATRAATIERLVVLEYVKRVKKTLIPTEKGIELIHNLPINELKSPELTAEWESQIDEIENQSSKDSASEKYTEFKSNIKENVTRWCEEIKEKGKKVKKNSNKYGGEKTKYVCPKCNSPIIKTKYYHQCSSDSCDFKIPLVINHVTLSSKDVANLFENKKTGLITNFKKKNDVNSSFMAYLVLDAEHKLGFSFTSSYKCPICKGAIKPIKTKAGDIMYVCENKTSNDDTSGCNFILFTKINGTIIAEEDVKKLLEGKQTKILKLKNKEGKEFKAKIELDPANNFKTKFIYQNK